MDRRSSNGGKTSAKIGTLLPNDSFHVRRSEKQNKLLASAGLDLFRAGLTFDGVIPQHQAARHPAIEPNLNSIPEDTTLLVEDSAESQAIVIVGAPLNDRNEPSIWLSNRIVKGIQLYWKILKKFAEEQVHSICYIVRPEPSFFFFFFFLSFCCGPFFLGGMTDAFCCCWFTYVQVPTGAEGSDQGMLEAEAIRNAVVGAGVSPHHVIMDCSTVSSSKNSSIAQWGPTEFFNCDGYGTAN
jgi:hypothetical protein